MYWAGGCPGRVQRPNKPYPGATRFFTPKQLHVVTLKPPIDWGDIVTKVVMGAGYFAVLLAFCMILAIALG